MITNAQIAEKAPEVRVTSSAAPGDINMYLVDDPEQGLVEVSREECYGPMDQAGQTFLPLQVQVQESAQASNTIKIQLDVTGIGGVEQSFLPVDMVIAIDSSGSMKDNDPSNLRLNESQEFVEKLSQTRKVRSAVVSWDDDIDFASPLTSNSSMTKMNISNIDSIGDTNLDIGLNSSISILDENTGRNESSSKVIIFFSDGEERYTPSGDVGSPADSARNKGYKIFSIGLNIQSGSIEEERLKDMANASGGQYYSRPSAENLQADFDKIFRTVVSTEPANVNVTEITQNYIGIDKNSFSIKPTSNQTNQHNQTVIRWENIGQYVGNDSKLSADERFSVALSAHILSSAGGILNGTLPVSVEGESVVEYIDPSGNVHAVNISQIYVNLNSQICKGEEEDIRLVFSKFIVPGSFNSTRESIVFKPNERIDLYVEFVGRTQKPVLDNFGNIQYRTNITGSSTITDNQGKNVINNTELSVTSFDSETLPEPIANSSGFYVFSYRPGHHPPLAPGDYKMTFSITDIFSKGKIENAIDFVIEPDVPIPRIDGALRALENAIVAQTNATRALQDILLKMIEEGEI